MAAQYLSFPFRLTPAGAVASADADTHLRQRIEQVLFTSPGERVMLPEFGCGARDLVFQGNNDVLAAATEFTVAKALQSALGSQVMVHAVNVSNVEETLHVEIVYTKTRDLERERLVFQLLPFAAGNRAEQLHRPNDMPAAATLCTSIDCGRAPLETPQVAAPPPPIDLMAKDYDSLLRAMLDLLPARAPGWADRSEADLGMALLELFAYSGDQLSYLQDRIALEGYLRTATQVESVRKLLRLVDYRIDPGHAAATNLAIEATGNAPIYLAAGFQVGTAESKEAASVVFESLHDLVVVPALGAMALAADAPSNTAGTEVVLATIDTALLLPGRRVLLQDGALREWASVAAASIGAATTTLTLAQPLRHRYASATTRVNANGVAATHGATQRIDATASGKPGQTLALDFAPLTYVKDEAGDLQSSLAVTVDGVVHHEVEDFVDSDPADAHVRLVRDNGGFVTLHFGDGVHGRVARAGAPIRIVYRVGIGEAGRVGADTLTVFAPHVFAEPSQALSSVRNPFASHDPGEPESIETAKLLGPHQLGVQRRAVVEADFERFAMQGVRVGGGPVQPLQAHARTASTGSWSTVFVSLDLPGRAPLDRTTRAAFEAALDAYRMAGTDVRVEDARYAALSIALVVDVRPEYFARDVRRAVERVLVGVFGEASPRLPFFAPGRFGFGQPVHLSDLYAAASAVEGVRSLSVTRFKRLGDRYPDREEAGFIDIGALEIARCDNDAVKPENGVLFVRTCGGKDG